MPAEISEPPTTAATVHPELAKLFNVQVADEPEATPETEPETPPVKPPVEPEAPAAAPVEDKKKSDLTSRLAPDFAAIETKPDVPAAPDPDLVALDAEIEAAPAKKKADLKKFRDQLATLKTENQTLKSRPAVPVEDPDAKTLLEMTTKQRDDALARLERYDLSASPAFQEKYMVPRQQKFDDARNLVKEAGGNADALAHAMSLVGKPRIEALEEIAESIPHQMMRGRFERLIEGIDADSRVINEKLANARQAVQDEAKNKVIRDHEKNVIMAKEAKSLLAAARSTLLEDVKLETLMKIGKPEFEPWDKGVDIIDELAEEIYLKSTPQEAAVAAYLAASAGKLRLMYQSERAARLAVEQENRELKGADPTLTADRRPAKIEGDSVESADIIGRLRSGAYKK